MRVYNLGLLLKIKGVLVTFNFSLRQFSMIILAIVRVENLGVWIADKAICAASHSCPLIASRQALICYRISE